MSDQINNINKIREPVVAGTFYPADKGLLTEDINNYLQNTQKENIKGKIEAIMVPHAGYVYSGGVAAEAYKHLVNKKVDTVVLMCNSHQNYFSGVAVDESDAWETPLDQVVVDKKLAKSLVDSSPLIDYNSRAHQEDHVLEVQIPFLQTVLAGEFKIVPLLFGNTDNKTHEELARSLKNNLGKNDLLVISTDLSHYPKYSDANTIDNKTLSLIEDLNIQNLDNHISQTEKAGIANEETLCCGIEGVKTIMRLTELNKWQAKVLKYANSGDTAIGDKSQVVGYGAVVFYDQDEEIRQELINDLSIEQKNELLKIARSTVESYINEGKIADFNIVDERLMRKEGAFVTLHQDSQLRGCIGQILPSEKPLWQVVQDMAIAAATEDHRFQPVSKKDLNKLDYEVSVLSVPEPVDNWQDIEMGIHGVIVKKGYQSGVFLPQVATETGWDREEFLAELCSQKAGLPRDCYKRDPDVVLEVFSAQVFGEK